jgi:hypothetical protein
MTEHSPPGLAPCETCRELPHFVVAWLRAALEGVASPSYGCPRPGPRSPGASRSYTMIVQCAGTDTAWGSRSDDLVSSSILMAA